MKNSIINVWKTHQCVSILIFALVFTTSVIIAQEGYVVKGYVKNELGEHIVGASVKIVGEKVSVITDKNGTFIIKSLQKEGLLIISHIGYVNDTVFYKEGNELNITLKPVYKEIEEAEVINTGYQQIPKERATGAFTHINQNLINRSSGGNILNRLEGVTNGLNFDMTRSNGEPSGVANLRIRGISTINGDTKPLIVVDNFPYEMSINSINPNDVESITVLKDAAAASIWGARAANGVIVITTKNAKSNKLAINLSSSIGVVSKPDLFYNSNYISAKETIDLEKFLFSKGLYRINDFTEFSPVVDLLFQHSLNQISNDEMESKFDFFAKQDIRKDATEYLYRTGVNQQYALSLNGKTDKNSFLFSLGYDDNQSSTKRDNNKRITFLGKNTFVLSRKWTAEATVNFINQSVENNGLGLRSISPPTWGDVYTYASLKNQSNDFGTIVRGVRPGYASNALNIGLLDWQYRPLQELELNDNSSNRLEVRLNGALKYEISKGFNVEGRYQYHTSRNENRKNYDQDSFFVRNLVNRFTQSNFSRPIPYGGILDSDFDNLASHYGRFQVNYTNSWKDIHNLFFLAGAEMRQDKAIDSGSKRLYGYNDDLLTLTSAMDFKTVFPTRPNSSSLIPSGNTAGKSLLDRYMSYYGNIGYDYLQRYLLSASIRWDGSNIFGVDFNQKGVPLWSIGLAWNLHKEEFFNLDNVDYLKFRATYGANGNIVKSQSALPYISYGFTNVVSPLLTPARVGSVGNPSLSWEKVNSLNLGLDFSLFKNRISGSIDVFDKKATNLLGADYLDPTTGIIPVVTYFNIDNTRNYADMHTNGVDLSIETLNLNKSWRWKSHFLMSYVSNKITNFYTADNLPITSYLTYGTAAVRKDVSRDQLYSIPWHGLNDSGDPLVLFNGELSTDYIGYFNALKYDDLQATGVTVAPYYGSLRNTFEWKDIVFSFNILWRAGHKMRRESINYSELFRAGLRVHKDMLNRWTEPGDELLRDVPALLTTSNTRRDQAYLFSDALIENASSIRLKDVQLSYFLNPSWTKKLGLTSVKFNMYLENLGILWKKTSYEIDPDARSFYPVPKQIHFGLQANF